MNSYLKILACVTGALMVAITGANYLIDPYMMSGVLLPHGLNAIKPAFSDHHALGKPFVFAQRKPLAIVLGTSRENHGIDPDYDAWPAPAQQRFNLALDSASIGDLERLFEHATTAGAVRQVVIALDFLNMFDANMHGAINFDADLLQSERHSAARTRLNSLRYFASWAMLRDSVETLRNQDPQLIEFEATGRRNARVFDSAAHRFGQQHMFTFSETRYLRARANLPLQQRYSLTDKQGLPTLLPLARILDSAAAKRVDVRIYMTPVHARQLEIYRLLELWPALEDWKSAVARIAEGSYLRRSTSHFTVWDFSDYSQLTTEAVPEPGDVTTRMRWYWESSHYTRALGNLVLDRIFARENPELPADFGLLLRNGELDAYLAGIRERGRRYRESHPRDIEQLTRAADEVAVSGIVLAM